MPKRHKSREKWVSDLNIIIDEGLWSDLCRDSLSAMQSAITWKSDSTPPIARCFSEMNSCVPLEKITYILRSPKGLETFLKTTLVELHERFVL